MTTLGDDDVGQIEVLGCDDVGQIEVLGCDDVGQIEVLGCDDVGQIEPRGGEGSLAKVWPRVQLHGEDNHGETITTVFSK